MDEFSSLKAYANKKKGTHHNHDWREESQHNSTQKVSDSNEEKQTDVTLREGWLKKVMSHNLSPLEHKWLCRILLKDMEIRLGHKTIMRHYSKYAMELW